MSRRARREVSAGGVVIRRLDGHETQVLLIRDPYKNWGLPKGHLEASETEAQAALREVQEETGLTDLVLMDELPTIDWYFRLGDVLVHKFCRFYLMESRAGEPVPEETEGITECRWMPIDEAIASVTYANAREVIREAKRVLDERGPGVPS